MNITTERVNALEAVEAAFPNIDRAQAMRIAEWAVTSGPALLDAERIDAAARELGEKIRSNNQCELRGIVQHVVQTYLSIP